MQHRHLCSLLSLLLLIGMAPVAQASKLYKWTDEQGQIHYSDLVPPEAAAREREVKSGRGITVDRVEAAKSPEQLAAEQAAREREDAQRRAAAEAARRRALADRTLLLTFSNTAQIARARDERVAVIKGQITLTQERIAKLQEQLQKTRQQAANAERTGRGDPQQLHKRARGIEQRIVEHEGYIREREQEVAAIIERFDADAARFEELKAAASH